MKIVILGLSITSSWGNGHATTYRGLVRELDARGHDVLFLERDATWGEENRDLPKPPYGRTRLYRTLSELKRKYSRQVREAHLVVVGSYVPDGAEIGKWVTRIGKGVSAFYDIDAPVTLAKLERGDAEYITRALIPKYDLYLSFSGGPTLERLEKTYGSRMARALYCSFDPALFYPEASALKWDLGYLGTYSAERQPALEKLMLEPARKLPRSKFMVAGPQYPETIDWPKNVQRRVNLPSKAHRQFYGSQRFTLNVTRGGVVAAGFSPSVRLFEAAACGTPIISDSCPGLDKIFKPRREILIARSAKDILAYLNDLSEAERREIGWRARDRVLLDHTAAHRAGQIERYVAEAVTGQLMA